MSGAHPHRRSIRIATRGSALALWQADHVAALLTRSAVTADVDLTVEKVVIATTADRRLDIPIDAMGGKGVFVKEIQAAVLDGRADIAVHSGKDLPAITPDELIIVAVPERGDPRDALIGCTLDALPDGAHIATGSIRRRAQLAALRPDLVFSGLRGNIATRLEKADGFDAIVMAVAAIERLGLALDDRIVEILEPSVMLPQVAQGALAVECRADDPDTFALIAPIEHVASRIAVDAERAFLAELGGDCDLPVAAHATVDEAVVHLDAAILSPDGSIVLQASRSCSALDVAVTGREIARHLLDDVGGAALLGR